MPRPEGYTERLQLMDAGRIERALARIAAEIHERHPRPQDLVLVGIRSRGVPLARRIAAALADEGVEPAVGALDITLYRDDLTAIAPQPILRGTDIPVPIDDRAVVLVDDVLFTGRTVRAALDELVDFGRPSRIELAVLIDRGHRELPIRPDYVGKTVTTSREESVQVMLLDHDGEDRVALLEKSHS